MLIEKDNIFQIISSEIEDVNVNNVLSSREELRAGLRVAEENFEQNYTLAKARLEFVFCEDFNTEESTQATYMLMQEWHAGESLFSTMSMVLVALERFGFVGEKTNDSDDDKEQIQSLIHAILVASILAEIPNNLPYHNNLHFRKVLLHVMRMVAVHNYKIYKDTSRHLSKIDIAKLIIGACIHDIGHEGEGNFIDHKYHLAMIEQRSYDYAYPYLKHAGLDDDILNDIRVMLIVTDVSPVGDPISPVNQLRSVYEYHFGMDADSHEDVYLSSELTVLKEDSHLCFLCVMLQEADIMNSAGVDYDITRFESVAISKEIGLSHSLPEDTLLFLITICKGKLLSDAARYLAADNLDHIIKRVMKDFRSGNNSYL
ncbi:MAG: hypothetical protein KAJ40_01135 [Alphaproteobacteria bacterium]|nr:hypothetical protein [Alphaproteobacteria bacterium]